MDRYRQIYTNCHLRISCVWTILEVDDGGGGRSSQTEATQKKIYQNRTFFRELEGGKLPLFGSHPQIIPTLLHGITPTAISGSVVWRVLESDVRIDCNQYWDRCWINLASIRSIVVFATSSNRTHHIEIVPTAISRSVLWRDLEFDVRRADGDHCWINLAPLSCVHCSSERRLSHARWVQDSRN